MTDTTAAFAAVHESVPGRFRCKSGLMLTIRYILRFDANTGRPNPRSSLQPQQAVEEEGEFDLLRRSFHVVARAALCGHHQELGGVFARPPVAMNSRVSKTAGTAWRTESAAS